MNLKWTAKEVIARLLLLQIYSKINGVKEYSASAEGVNYDETGFLEVLESLNQKNKIDLSNLERLELFHCASIKEFIVSEQCILGNLNKVYIGVCPLLLNLNFLMCVPSLLEIEVSYCLNLRHLPLDLDSANLLQKIKGKTKWWDGLIWDDEAVKDTCSLKFVPTPFQRSRKRALALPIESSSYTESNLTEKLEVKNPSYEPSRGSNFLLHSTVNILLVGENY
ncbi:hypothetical protein PTKIN_Ptkin19aG0082100 [Pterospermum kingtungense]